MMGRRRADIGRNPAHVRKSAAPARAGAICTARRTKSSNELMGTTFSVLPRPNETHAVDQPVLRKVCRSTDRRVHRGLGLPHGGRVQQLRIESLLAPPRDKLSQLLGGFVPESQIQAASRG